MAGFHQTATKMCGHLRLIFGDKDTHTAGRKRRHGNDARKDTAHFLR